MNGFVTVIALIAVVAGASATPLNATCSVSSYDDIAAAVKSCTTLTISDITVPASTTLELSLQTGTTLTIAGTWKWEYAEWAGPLLEIKGSKVTVKGSSAVLDGRGKIWFEILLGFVFLTVLA